MKLIPTSKTRPHSLLLLTLAATALLFAAGCGRDALVDERNVYYVRGMKLRDQKRHEEAAEAFQTCLRLSPRSAKAHLQLALLYEESLDDPLQCVYHYREFLRMRPDDPNADVVEDWLADAEKQLLGSLAGKHPDNNTAVRPAAGRPQTSKLDRKREESLLKRISELSSKNLALHTTIAELKRRLQENLTIARNQPPNQTQQVEPKQTTGQETSLTNTPTHQQRETADVRRRPAVNQTEKQPAREPTPAIRRHRVTRGDTLSSVCRRYYGSLKYWPLLRDYNQDVLHGRETLRLGETLQIPPLEMLLKAERQ